MASWRPPTREPDALRAALYDYLRTRVLKVMDAENALSVRPLGRAEMIMGDGQKLTVDLKITPVEAPKFNERATIVYTVAGHAADPRLGYEVTGQVVIDARTRAFLLLEAEPTVLNRR
ncbi:MAG: hypothetical protein AAGF59_07255 [Pseudomonadota bacterium]